MNISTLNSTIDSAVNILFNNFTKIKVGFLEFKSSLKEGIPYLKEMVKPSKEKGVYILKDVARFMLSALCGVCAWHITLILVPIITFIVAFFLGAIMSVVVNIGFVVLGYPLVAWIYVKLKSAIKPQKLESPQYFDFDSLDNAWDYAKNSLEQDASVLPDSFYTHTCETVAEDDAPSAIAKAISDSKKDMLEEDFNLPSIDEKLTLADILSKTNNGIKRLLHNSDYILLTDICQMIDIHTDSDVSREHLISVLYQKLKVLKEKDQDELHIQLEAYQ